MNQKQLIEQLKTLKEIKPRKEWAVLLKSQILSPYTKVAIKVQKNQNVLEAPTPERKLKSAGILDILSSVFLQRRLAYAFAVVLFLIVGVFGFAQYTMPGDLLFPIKKIAEQSQAALSGQIGLKQNMANLNNRINDLAQVAKQGRVDNVPSAISEIDTNASQLAKTLKDNPTDIQTLKEIAVSLKTLANMPGTDLTANQNVKDLYQTVVENQIADLQKSTLTEEQQTTLAQAEDFYSQGKYTDALEKLLFIK